jgi:hypothetical protein
VHIRGGRGVQATPPPCARPLEKETEKHSDFPQKIAKNGRSAQRSKRRREIIEVEASQNRV